MIFQKITKKRTKYVIKAQNDYQSESIENNNNWQHSQIIKSSREQTFSQTEYSTTIMRILIKERMLSTIMKRYSTESKITTTTLKKLKLKNKSQKFRVWLQQNNLKRNFTSINSEQKYLMIDNESTELHTQSMIRQLLHCEKTQRSHKIQIKSQTILRSHDF